MDADQDTSRYLQVEESDDSYASVASLLAATAEEKSLSPIPGISVPGSPSPTPPAEFPTVSPESVICLEERPPPYIPPPPGPPGQDLGVEVEELEERSIHSFTRGDYKEALACFERCLQIRIKVRRDVFAYFGITKFISYIHEKNYGRSEDTAFWDTHIYACGPILKLKECVALNANELSRHLSLPQRDPLSRAHTSFSAR